MAESFGSQNPRYGASYGAECVWKYLALSGRAAVVEKGQEEDVD